MLSIRKNEAMSSPNSSPMPSSPPPPLPTSSSRSTIGADLSITGNLVSTGELHVEGSIQGDIQGVNILIKNSAKITGTITGQDVIIHGEVMGSVKAEKVVLASSCRLEGDIFHQSLSIEQGAYFEGKSRRAASHSNSPEMVVTPQQPVD